MFLLQKSSDRSVCSDAHQPEAVNLESNQASVREACDAGLLAGAVTMVWQHGNVLQVNEIGQRDVGARSAPDSTSGPNGPARPGAARDGLPVCALSGGAGVHQHAVAPHMDGIGQYTWMAVTSDFATDGRRAALKLLGNHPIAGVLA